MCTICVEFNMGKLTRKEAWRNLREMVSVDDIQGDEEARNHYYDLAEKLAEEEFEDGPV